MLKFGDYAGCDYMAGYFDSRIDYGHLQRTPLRTVIMAELEFFSTDGVSYIDGEQFRFRRGMMLCIQPGAKRYSDLPFCNHYLKIGDTEPMVPFFHFTKQLPLVSYVSQPDVYIQHIMSIREAIAKNNSWMMMEHLYAIFGQLEAEMPTLRQNLGTPFGQTAAAAIAFMNENLNAHLTLADIAGAVCLSPVYFHSMFRKEIGETPLKYLTAKRLERAKILLLSTEISVPDIAEQCGFSSDTYFSAVFRSAEGMTPRQYRSHYRNTF